VCSTRWETISIKLEGHFPTHGPRPTACRPPFSTNGSATAWARCCDNNTSAWGASPLSVYPITSTGVAGTSFAGLAASAIRLRASGSRRSSAAGGYPYDVVKAITAAMQLSYLIRFLPSRSNTRLSIVNIGDGGYAMLALSCRVRPTTGRAFPQDE
jgi:hypothetical protein